MGGGGGGVTYDFTASNQLANVLQQQYNTYKSLFTPVENQLISFATNPNTISNAQTQAGQIADAASANAQGSLTRRLQQQGLQPSPQQTQELQRQQTLQSSLNKVGAMNNAGLQTYDTITQALTGAAPNASDFTQGLQGMSS